MLYRDRLSVGFELPGGPSNNRNTSSHMIHHVPKIETQLLLRVQETVFSDSWSLHPCHHPRAHLHVCTCTHPVCVVDNDGVGVAIVGWVCIGVIAEPSQHGGNLGHVPQHVPRDVTGPLGECFQVHRFDDLVCGSLDPGERGQAGWGPSRPRGCLGGVPAQSLRDSRNGWGEGTWPPASSAPSTVRPWVSHLASADLLCTVGRRVCRGSRKKSARQCTPLMLQFCFSEVSDFLEIPFYLCDYRGYFVLET